MNVFVGVFVAFLVMTILVVAGVLLSDLSQKVCGICAIMYPNGISPVGAEMLGWRWRRLKDGELEPLCPRCSFKDGGAKKLEDHK